MNGFYLWLHLQWCHLKSFFAREVQGAKVELAAPAPKTKKKPKAMTAKLKRKKKKCDELCA